MFDSYIAYQARLRPDAPAVATLQGSASFAKLDADIDRAVPLLRRLAPASGEAVCVDIVDPYLHWVLVLALARSGIASAPATDRASTAKVSDRADDDHTNTLLIGLAEVERILSGPRPSIPPVRPNEEALGRILKSSGTTGEEKRLGMSWRAHRQWNSQCAGCLWGSRRAVAGEHRHQHHIRTGRQPRLLGLRKPCRAWARRGIASRRSCPPPTEADRAGPSPVAAASPCVPAGS